MKKILTILFLCLTFIANAQEKVKLPAIVEANFNKEFKEINDVEWSVYYRGKYNKDLRFEAQFIKGNSKFLVSYSEDGIMKVIQKSIPINSLNDRIMDYLKDTYPTFEINEASLIVKADQKSYYNVGISGSSNFFILVFSEEGYFLYLSPFGERI